MKWVLRVLLALIVIGGAAGGYYYYSTLPVLPDTCASVRPATFVTPIV